MRAIGIYLLGFFLAVVLHVTWHFALPIDHDYSLRWSYYWTLPALGFLTAGIFIARVWPRRALATAIWVALFAFVLNQGLVPILGVLVEERRFGYPLDPVWWNGFVMSLVTGLPLLLGGAWLFRPVFKDGDRPIANLSI